MKKKKNYLDLKIQILRECVSKKPEASFTYFVEDLRKKGGKYVIESGKIKKIDNNKNLIFLENDIIIPIKDIIEIESEAFKKLFCENINFNELV